MSYTPLGNPPAYGMVTRAYRASLRPVVVTSAYLSSDTTKEAAHFNWFRVTVAIFTAIWTLIWAVDLFQDIDIDRRHGKPKLATFSIVLGTMYITVCAIQIFGILAGTTQRVPLVRLYTWLTILASLLVITAGFMRVVTHFVFKNDLISECANVVTGTDIVFRFGIWGTPVHDILDAQEAQNFCQRAWNHDSLSEIVALIIEIVLAAFFVTMAFSYYRQLLDPTVSRSKAPSSQHQARTETFPTHYNPPYLSYDAPPGGFAPPPGPPPQAQRSAAPPYGYGVGDEDTKSLPPYDHDHDGMIFGKDTKDDKDRDHDDPFEDFENSNRTGHGRPGGESRDALV
ncbi:hypothetical protein NLI96_g1300 [Meripilus lineatus]|uniref:Uncharacterized protein n=1 Tax=Meripilus lineatus TaxID=2056292 RepID=A0AAD5VAE7_9APHY|nr:hypothetical protein NLI96_g1300 [Physisporinus lineatus]